jgi:hypothetical protein
MTGRASRGPPGGRRPAAVTHGLAAAGRRRWRRVSPGMESRWPPRDEGSRSPGDDTVSIRQRQGDLAGGDLARRQGPSSAASSLVELLVVNLIDEVCPACGRTWRVVAGRAASAVLWRQRRWTWRVWCDNWGHLPSSGGAKLQEVGGEIHADYGGVCLPPAELLHKLFDASDYWDSSDPIPSKPDDCGHSRKFGLIDPGLHTQLQPGVTYSAFTDYSRDGIPPSLIFDFFLICLFSCSQWSWAGKAQAMPTLSCQGNRSRTLPPEQSCLL